MRPEPVYDVKVMEEGRSALEKANKELGEMSVNYISNSKSHQTLSNNSIKFLSSDWSAQAFFARYYTLS